MSELPAQNIRSAQTADAADLLAIYAPVVIDSPTNFEFEPPTVGEFARRIERTLATDPWLVLEREGVIAGYAYAAPFRARPAYATTRETTVYVHAGYHRSGVGRALMRALLSELAARGSKKAIAIIALPNDASVTLHESLGFTHVGTIEDVARKFGRWHSEGIWEYRLDSNVT